jgi:hypothetical protein
VIAMFVAGLVAQLYWLERRLERLE